MREITVEHGPEGWRSAVRALLSEGCPPGAVQLSGPGERTQVLPLLAGMEPPRLPVGRRAEARAPRAFFTRAARAACHTDPGRYDLIYRLAWRQVHGESSLLEDRADPDVHRLLALDAAVRRDAHKTKAFVRFRRLDEGSFAAWHGADHRVLRLVGPFFRDRFSDMRWTIVTPLESAAFDGRVLRYAQGLSRERRAEAGIPDGDALDDMWLAYYAAIFNPARVKLNAMRSEMPAKHWRTMPETALIAPLVREAPQRLREMAERLDPAVDARRSAEGAATLEELGEALGRCQACALGGAAKQPVALEVRGPHAAPVRRREGESALLIVGEQPGDEEDLEGRPFVGPAGQLLDRAMRVAGLDRRAVHLTNAVKHFRFERQGARRLHVRPTTEQVRRCRPWLLRELELVRPRVVVTLGVTATRAVLGQLTRMADVRGRSLSCDLAPVVVPTWHPAAALRAAEDGLRQRIEHELTEALAKAGALAHADRFAPDGPPE